MQVRRLILIFNIIILTAQSEILFPDTSKSYHLDDLVQMAIETNEELKLLDEEIARSKMELKNAQTGYFPRLTLQGSAGVDLFSIGSFDTDNNLGSDLILDWNFFQNGLVALRVDQAKANVELVLLQKKRQMIDLAYQIKLMGMDLLIRKEQISLAEQDLSLARKMFEKSEVEFKQGGLRRSELLKFEMQIFEAEHHLEKMKREYDLLIKKVKNETGIVHAEVELIAEPDAVTYPSREKCMSFVLTSRTEIREGEIQYYLSKKAVRVAKLARFPRVDLFAGNAFALDDFERTTDQFQFRTGIIARYPLYDGGQTKLQIVLAEMAVRKAEFQWNQMKKKVLDETEKAYDEFVNEQALLEGGKNQMTSIGNEWEQAQMEYKTGELSDLELEESRVTLERARIRQFELNLGLLRAFAVLSKTLGLVQVEDMEELSVKS